MGKNFHHFFLQLTLHKCHRELLLHFVLFSYILWLFRVGAGCWEKGSFSAYGGFVEMSDIIAAAQLINNSTPLVASA